MNTLNDRDPEPICMNNNTNAQAEFVTDSSSDRTDEKSKGFMSALQRIVPKGGLLSGVLNLAGSSLGAGILALPSAFNASGIVVGTMYLIVIYLLTVFSIDILARTSLKTGINSYEAMARHLFGRGGDILTAIVMFIKCFGACIAYTMSVSDLLFAFLKDESVKGFFSTKAGNRVMTSIIFLVFMLPLSLPKRINSLRYVSLFAVLFIVYFVICIFVHFLQYGLDDGFRGDLVLFRGGNEGIRGLGMFMFAYLCQSNFFEVWNEMKPRQTTSGIRYQAMYSMLICTILYWFAGFFGYAEFGPAVNSSILRMYTPLHSPMMAIAYVGIVIKLCVAFALHILPCRDSAHHLLGWSLDTVPWWKNAVLCTVISCISLVCGLFIPDVDVVFGLLGSLTGGFIAFVFPALFYMYAGGFSRKGVGTFMYLATYLLLFSGIVVICFGTSATVFKVATTY